MPTTVPNRLGVKLYVGHSVIAVTDDGVTTATSDGQHFIPTDTVVAAFGVRPNDSLTRALQERGVTVEAIGDCVEPAKVGEAVNAGYLVATGIG